MNSSFLFLAILVVGLLLNLEVRAEENCYLLNQCPHQRRTSSVNPSASTQIKINPSAVPTEKGWGVEGIFFDSEVDLALVRGNGRMGAAISPSASEETFFGAPGFENDGDYLARKIDRHKYPNEKYTLAAAMNLIDKKGSGHRRFSLKLGGMAKYNKLSKNVTPGAGLSGAWGPFSFGYSVYGDQTQLQNPMVENDPFLIKYGVQTYNVGLYLSSLVLNYSHLRLETEDKLYLANVQLFTASLSAGRFIFTGAYREEDSPRAGYSDELKNLEFQKIKKDYFGGIQYQATQNIMIGGLYNYYLLKEVAFTATLFF